MMNERADRAVHVGVESRRVRGSDGRGRGALRSGSTKNDVAARERTGHESGGDRERRRDAETHGRVITPSREKSKWWALGFALFCAACGGSKKEEKERPIEMLVAQDAESLDPRFTLDTVGLRVSRLVHAGLFRLDEGDLHPVAYVAKSFHFTSDRELVVELRDDVHFHSGRAVDASDVVATFRAIADPKVGSRHARIFEAIDHVDADGDRRVVFHLKRPHSTLLTDLEMPVLRADQAALPPADGLELDGLGPFKIASRREGEIVLEPAHDAALPAPKHAVVVRVVHDENARALRLLSGSGDIVQNGFSPSLLPALEREQGLNVVTRPGANITYMIFRVDRGPFTSKDARRAVAEALDRDLIARTLLSGHAHVATTVLPEEHWAHGAAPENAVRFDPDHAAVMLHDMGARGQSFELLTSTDRVRSTVARFFAQSLRAKGVEVNVRELELGTLIARLNAGDFDAATLQLPELAEPNALRVFLHSAYIPPSGSNRGRVQDPELDALLDEGDRTIDLEARKRVYARFEARMADMLYLVPLWHEDQVAVNGTRAKTYQPSAEGRWLGLARLP
jgi:peptide/nickel transport system substrate-binding protein